MNHECTFNFIILKGKDIMKFMKQKFSKALALVICLIMTVMSLPMSAFAAVATDLPENMADHAILRALAYTGYNVEKQKSDRGFRRDCAHGAGEIPVRSCGD